MASQTKEPETFQHYQVMRRDDGSLWELGRGAMGVTYKAFDMNLRAPVALKVINALHLDSETSRARFVREARAAAGLRHRNVASVYHLGHDDQSFFYAMEYVDGDTVEGLVKHQGVLPPAMALQIALQVSRALGAAAKQQLVHRDIKPANLMVVTEDEDEDQLIVKVIDFGLARPAIGGEGSAHITMGGFVGTPQYASPEQLEEKELDARSDIYSLGVTLWYMLAGKPPFSGTLGSVFIQQLTKEPPWEHLVGIPQPVRNLLKNLLEKDPDNRPQSPVELRRQIEVCLKKLPSESARISLPVSRDTDSGTETPETSTLTRTETPLTTLPEDTEADLVTSALTAVPATGSILGGHYALDFQAGEGNNGRVFRARDLEKGNSRVAVKILHPDVLKAPAQVTRLEATLDKLRAAPHPNLLSFQGLRQSGEVRFLVGEWVDGFNFVEFLRTRGELDAREVFPLLSQAAAAADHAKNHGLTRLELGLHQILAHFPDAPLDEKGTAAGIKTALSLPVDRWPTFTLKFDALGILREAGDSVTLAGDMTMLPARPGLDRDTQTSIRGLVEDSHIFSLAALVYELLNGSPPAQHRADGHDTKYVALPALNEAANAVLRKALSPNPGFATSTDFYRELLVAGGFDQSATTPVPQVAPNYFGGADHTADSSETLFFHPDAPGTGIDTDDSSAETVVFHEDRPVRPPTLARPSGADAPGISDLIVTARSSEPLSPPPAVEESRDAAPPSEPTAIEDDGSDAPTLQGYSFVSRNKEAVQPAEPEIEDSRRPVIEIDSYGSDDTEAPTLQGYSFKRPIADEANTVAEPLHPAPEVVHDDYGSEEVDAPTLQGYSFKAQPADSPSVVVHPDASIVPDDLAGEVEAPTLQGYSFKSPPTDLPDVVIAPFSDGLVQDTAQPVVEDVSEPIDAPTLQGYSFKAQPNDLPDIVVAPPSTDPTVDDDAPTLQGYSFKAHPADIVVPPSSSIGHDAAEHPSETDTPTLEGYSFNARAAEVILPSVDDEAITPQTEKPESKAAEQTARENLDGHPLVPAATEMPEVELPTISSQFLVVADAPVTDVPLPVSSASKDEPSVSAEQPVSLRDQASVSLEPSEAASVLPSQTTAREFAASIPVSNASAAVPASVSTSPLVTTPFVDKALLDESELDRPKRTNLALIGGAVTIGLVALIVVVFAMRGGHSQPQPQVLPAVVNRPPTTTAQDQEKITKNTAPTPPSSVSVQRTPIPVSVAAVQTTPPVGPSPSSQTTDSEDGVAGAQNKMPASVAATASAQEEIPNTTNIAAAKSEPEKLQPAPTHNSARSSEDDDEDKQSSGESSRHTAQESKRREPAPTPRPAPPREREPRPAAATPPPERVVKREPKPEPPKPAAKKETPKPAAPEPDRPRGPAVPFMR